MNKLTSEWVEKAENDFHSADLLLHGGEVPFVDTGCFHCQQSAEKYVKAYLQEHRVRFERTHVLAALLDLCVARDGDFRNIASDLDSLEGYAVAIRYPGSVVPVELAEQAFGAASRVRDFMRRKLRLKK